MLARQRYESTDLSARITNVEPASTSATTIPNPMAHPGVPPCDLERVGLLPWGPKSDESHNLRKA
jgi:hypothetical protein